MNIVEIRKQAEKEIQEEDYRKAVDKYKERLRKKTSLIDSIFPFKIVIIRKDNSNEY